MTINLDCLIKINDRGTHIVLHVRCTHICEKKYNDMMLGISVKSDYTSKASRISVNNAVAIIKALNSFHLVTRGLECVGTGVFNIEW